MSKNSASMALESYRAWKATRDAFLERWLLENPEARSQLEAPSRAMYRVGVEFREQFWDAFEKGCPEASASITRNQRHLSQKQVCATAREKRRAEAVVKLAAKIAGRHQEAIRRGEERRRQRDLVKMEKAKEGRARQSANMKLFAMRTEARKERDDFMVAWREKWGFIFKGKREAATKHRRRRAEAMRGAGDAAARKAARRIQDNPCSCYWCGEFLPRGGTVDHVLPLARGGKHEAGNLAAACAACNSKRGKSLPADSVHPEFALGPALL